MAVPTGACMPDMPTVTSRPAQVPAAAAAAADGSDDGVPTRERRAVVSNSLPLSGTRQSWSVGFGSAEVVVAGDRGRTASLDGPRRRLRPGRTVIKN